ncbi:MAG: TetR/AcrR family transcriptional regulator [Pseudomonadota bacterium]
MKVKSSSVAEPSEGIGKSKRRLQREGEILAAAREVFLEKGFERASISEIAARVGVVEGLVFRYFPSKRDLLNEVLRALYEPLISDVGEGFSRISGLRGRLRFIIWRHVRVYTETPGMAKLVLHEVRTGPEYVGSGLHDLHVQYTNFLRQTLVQAVADGELAVDVDLEFEMLRSKLYGGLEHMMWPVLYGKRSINVDTLADRFTDGLLHGLQSSPGPTDRIEARLAHIEELLAARPEAASRKRKPS